MAQKMTIDGNTAAAHVAYALSEVAAIYPITPSSHMAENADEWATADRKNIFGQKLRIAEMQSEAGAAGAVHGSLAAGALTTTFTASQGLLLMIPNMYKIAGELTPCVFHVSARALAYHALNIFGDHSDVMACRQTGFAMLASNSVQEVMDLALVSHLATLKAKVPFLHFFDGFRTSHEVSKIEMIDYADIKDTVTAKYMPYIRDFKSRALNPEHPVQKGTAQNPDIYFQNREACNSYYEAVPAIVEEAMEDVKKITGREYKLYQYYGAKNATDVIVIMGSGAEAVEETVDYINAAGGKVGLLKVRLYRPFSATKFVEALPKSVKNITVLDRVKECGSQGEPLYLDVVAALAELGRKADVLCGRYGLGSKEFNPSMINAIYKNMKASHPKNHFAVGIVDDVTGNSLDITEKIDAAPKGAISCKFYGLGSDGTVGSNKNSIKIIGNYTEKYAQAYFAYDSKKSGGITVSHLRFGDTPIKSSYLIDQADFVACHNPSYVTKYDMVSDLKDGGIFLLNSPWSAEEMDKMLPASMKNAIAKKRIKFYNIDAIKIVEEIGLGNRISTAMQACFFKLSGVIPYADAEKYMKEMVVKSFKKKGEKVVNMNFAAIDNAVGAITEIKYDAAAWATTAEGAKKVTYTEDPYFKNFISPVLDQVGDSLPVSAFKGHEDGTVPTGTTQYEKRGIAVTVPCWNKEACLQCNQCSLVCPHAVIRPMVQKEFAGAPDTFNAADSKGLIKGYKFRMQVSPLDCTGCGSCANTCPAKAKGALVMKPLAEALAAGEKENWDYAVKLPASDAPIARDTLIGSQLNKPLFEFSGACAGCGETPYVKLVTQLFGDRMVVANATGCSSIYGGSAPTCPYTTNDNGHGPAWANSLFEDNAEFGYGINLAYAQRRVKIADDMQAAIEAGVSDKAKALFTAWLDTYKDVAKNTVASEAVKAEIDALAASESDAAIKYLLEDIAANKDCLIKKSVWIFGGDGWAYDIGYGGLDHVLAMGEDVNVLVLDTEVYSNTGGQASKSSPTGAVAKFAAGGKITKKKDLGKMAMSYGYVYVAQIAMGANMNQTVKAIKEAENYDGPSLVIAYAPCINHGINMSGSIAEEKKAVDAGYWQLYRFNPELKEQGKNPFVLDSKEPKGGYQEFLMGENRYAQLSKAKPEVAAKLFELNEQQAKERYESYKKLAEEGNN